MYKKSPLLNFLAAHVLYIYFIHPHSLSRSGDFLIRKALVGIIFHREAFDQNQRLSAVFNDAAPAEHDGAAHERRPYLFTDNLIPVSREAHFIAFIYRVRLVPRFCAVEIYLSRLSVIEIVYRYRIWISAVAVDCEHSAAGGAQNFFCRFFAESVFNSANRSEHSIVSGDF